MEQNIAELKNKGMMRDYSISKSPDEFAFENMNIRLTPNEDNTGLSITNEKGPASCGSDVKKRLPVSTIDMYVRDGMVTVDMTYESKSIITLIANTESKRLYGIAVSGGNESKIFTVDAGSDRVGYSMFVNSSGLGCDDGNTLYKVYVKDSYIPSISMDTKVESIPAVHTLVIDGIYLTDRSGNVNMVDYVNDTVTGGSLRITVPKGMKYFTTNLDNVFSIRNFHIECDNGYMQDNSLVYMTIKDYASYISEGKELPGKDVVVWEGVEGEYKGYCQTPDSVILFTHGVNVDYIYKLTHKSDRLLDVDLLYSGNLGLDGTDEVETLFRFESEDVQKVYWVDGVNQPRVINIARHADPDKGATQFDFVSTVEEFPRVDIKKDYNSSGLFPSGTIQYGVSYYNKFGSETNLLWLSTVHYIAYPDRAAKADEKVNCSFNLKILNLDTKFDYVRVYSIIRTSVDTEPIVSIVGDYTIGKRKTMKVTDTNTNVTSIDASTLAFIGGRRFIADTIASKQDRLFLGGITIKDDDISDELRSYLERTIVKQYDGKRLVMNRSLYIKFEYKSIGFECESTLYPYKSQLLCGNKYFAYFKYGETYRFAIQFQTKTGGWTSAVWIGDAKCMLRPKTDIVSARINLPTAVFSWDINLTKLCEGYSNYRILYAETSTVSRNTVAQGVLCPTMFSLRDRLNNSPYAVSSWIMRPIGDVASKLGQSAYQEIQSMDKDAKPSFDAKEIEEVTTGETGTVISLMFTWDIEKVKKYWAKQGADTNVSRLWHYVLPLLGSLAGVGLGVGDVTWALFRYKYCLILSYSYRDGKIDEESIAIHCESRTNLNRMWSKVRSYILENLNTDLSDDMSKSEFKKLCRNQIQSVGRWSDCDWAKEDDPSLEYMMKLCPPKDIDWLSRYQLWGVYRKVNIHTNLNVRTAFSNAVEGMGYFVDDSLVTFHSPELEANQDVIDNNNLKMRIIGCVPITGGVSGAEIDVDTPGIVSSAAKIDADEHYVVENISNKYHTLVSDFLYEDSGWFADGDTLYPSRNLGAYKIYMWHKSSSIAGLNSNTFQDRKASVEFEYIPSNLKRKVFASKRFSMYNEFFKNPSVMRISPVRVIHDDNTTTVLNIRGESMYYYGNVDTLLTRKGAKTGVYVKDEDNGYDVEYSKSDSNEVYVKVYDPVRIKYKSTPHAVFAMTDGNMTDYCLPELDANYYDALPKGERFPWIKPAWSVDDEYAFVGLFNSRKSAEERLSKVVSQLRGLSEKVLVGAVMYSNTERYDNYFIVNVSSGNVVIEEPREGEDDDNYSTVAIDIPMRVRRICEWDGSVSNQNNTVMLDSLHNIWWRAEGAETRYARTRVLNESAPDYSYMFLAELYRDIPYETLYGGYDENQIENINWMVSSSPTPIGADVKSMGGDTYYQRWDCLKTYPYSEDDVNGVVDITSFMVESHINLDARCDINRKSPLVTLARPTNYNLFNHAYQQRDNIFTYKVLDEKYSLDRFGNQIVWSNAKIDTDEIDSWTNINMLSSMSLDGSKGDVVKLMNINDNVVAFQPKAVSVVNYNNPTQISTESGQPIEVVNSGLVNGFTMLTDLNGCQSKKSVCKGGSGVYFVDNLKRSLLAFGKEGMSLVSVKGMSQWFKENTSPDNPMRLSYDSIAHDLYISNDKTCLAFNEEIDAFSSFYSYEGMRAVFDTGGFAYSISGESGVNIYQMRAGVYNTFYGGKRNPWWITYKVNAEPMTEKIFTNVEYTADLIDGRVDEVNYKEGNPLERLDIWNEYQSGTLDLTKQINRLSSNTRRKFRLWRLQIPRDSLSNNRFDRIRNTWAYIRLYNSGESDDKAVLHNAIVRYYK